MSQFIGQKIGDYEILEELGRGAMGVVYGARQYSLDRPAALKVLAPDLARDENYVERFKREAILAATIIHPNIVTVYEAGTHMDLDSGERVHYFAMEHIEGETVQRRLARQDRIPADEVAAIGVRIAQGLEFAWRKARIIHRDIKPSNIFLTRSGDVKVADLGLARVAGDAQASLTATGAIIGTAYYMSPEQVRGESDLDFRSDIYSLGCTLYRMLCGQHLYEGAFASVIVKHLTEPPPSIRMVMPDCPVAIVKVIEKMLAKHPSGRQQSYAELIEDLRRAHEEIAAGSAQAPAVKKAPAPSSRSSLVFAGIAAVVALAGVMWWAPWQTAEQNVGGASAPRQLETTQSRGTEAAPTFQKPAEETGAEEKPAPAPMAFAPAAEAPAKPAAQPGQSLMASVGMELAPIPAGEFMLGSTAEEREWALSPAGGRANPVSLQSEGEQPRKAVIARGFWLGRIEVTVGQWKQFVAATGYVTDGEKADMSWAPLGPNTWSTVKGANWKNLRFEVAPRDDHPVCCVSWNDAVAFCAWLDGLERNAGRLPAGCKIRLPTEAEWEYACRAGAQTRFWWGDAPEEGAGRLHWRYRAPRDLPVSVVPVDSFGAKGRNKFGLADMLGNVWEWCLDGFDPAGAHGEYWAGDGSWRVLRGGAFGGGPSLPRSSLRERQAPTFASAACGFRVCCGR